MAAQAIAPRTLSFPMGIPELDRDIAGRTDVSTCLALRSVNRYCREAFKSDGLVIELIQRLMPHLVVQSGDSTKRLRPIFPTLQECHPDEWLEMACNILSNANITAELTTVPSLMTKAMPAIDIMALRKRDQSMARIQELKTLIRASSTEARGALQERRVELENIIAEALAAEMAEIIEEVKTLENWDWLPKTMPIPREHPGFHRAIAHLLVQVHSLRRLLQDQDTKTKAAPDELNKMLKRALNVSIEEIEWPFVSSISRFITLQMPRLQEQASIKESIAQMPNVQDLKMELFALNRVLRSPEDIQSYDDLPHDPASVYCGCLQDELDEVLSGLSPDIGSSLQQCVLRLQSIARSGMSLEERHLQMRQTIDAYDSIIAKRIWGQFNSSCNANSIPTGTEVRLYEPPYFKELLTSVATVGERLAKGRDQLHAREQKQAAAAVALP